MHESVETENLVCELKGKGKLKWDGKGMKKPMTQTRFRTKEGKTRGGSGRKSEHLRLKTRARKKNRLSDNSLFHYLDEVPS